jgi:hypothetical protein
MIIDAKLEERWHRQMALVRPDELATRQLSRELYLMLA